MAGSIGKGMDGDGWQRLCLQVLHDKHPEDLVPVPDTLGGDAGLEAYTVTGLAYQCYSPDEPLTAAQRYQRQRDKMTVDVGKFIDNQDKLTPLLGPVTIRRWILLVPVADSRAIVEHAMRQTERIRAAALPYAQAEIFVLVQTLSEHCEASLDAVINRRLATLLLPPLDDADYSSVNSELVDVMHEKLQRIAQLADDDRRRKFVAYMLRVNLGSREHRDYIRDHYPELDAELDHLLRDLEVRLESEYALAGDEPTTLLTKVRSDAEDRVRRALPNVREGDGRAIADGQVADWLMRCPLDFADVENVAAVERR